MINKTCIVLKAMLKYIQLIYRVSPKNLLTLQINAVFIGWQAKLTVKLVKY